MITPTIGFFEMRATDVEAAAAFYTRVFGLVASPFGEYVMLSTADGVPVAGLEQVELAPPTDGFFRPTFDTDDLEAALALVEDAGGAVTTPRQLISEDFGWWAAATDPFGNRLQLSTSAPAATSTPPVEATS